MKWGELPGDDRNLLFWVLWFAIECYSDFALSEFLKKAFTMGGLVGDPEWKFDCLTDDAGCEFYSFFANSYFSGIEPECRSYNVEVVRETVKEALLALVDKVPAKADEVASLIARYGF